MIHKTCNHVIDEHALSLQNAEGVKLNIRPKTCQLLLYLVKHEGQAIDKQTLLETVWAETVVTEQVVFQSINEIRQLFREQDVIKTIPKQGYVWLPEVVTQAVSINEDSDTDRVGLSSGSKLLSVKALYALGLLLIAIFISTFFMPKHTAADGEISLSPVNQNLTGSIVILPINNQIQSNDHNWIRLGMMDQLIQRLPSSKEYGVLRTDYVLEVLKRADAPFVELEANHIQSIFKVSGAELIVAAKLAGAPHDYQLSYTFYFRDQIKKGVLLNGDIQGLIDEFSGSIGEQLGMASLPSVYSYQRDFNNELLGNALEKQLAGDFTSAKPMLESVVLTSPENMTAQRLLIDNLVRMKEFEQAKRRLEDVIPVAQRLENIDALSQFLYTKALLMYVTYDDAEAAKWAEQALVLATEIRDWLLMAYITDLQAVVAVNDNNFDLAESLFYQVMQHHQVLKCPAGEAQSWNRLAWLAKLQNRPEQFSQGIDRAIEIAKERGLTRQLDYFEKIKEKGFSHVKP